MTEPLQVALVTGASRGIGRAIALDLAKQKYTVLVNYKSREADAANVVAEITQAGGTAFAMCADVAKEEDVVSLFRGIKQKFGELHALVNNAGITDDGFLMMMSSQKWDKVIAANLRSVFLCCREGMKLMARRNKGVIVNLSSTSGLTGQDGQLNYSASKGGIITFTKGLAREAAKNSIRANVVCPGFIDTEMTKQIPRELLLKYIEMIPLRRLGTPEEVAALVSFLVSDKAAYITGKSFVIDGGLTPI